MQVSRRNMLRAALGAAAHPWWAGASSLAVLWQPYVQNVRRASATVRWATPEAGDASLDLIAADGQRVIVPAATQQFGADPAIFRHTAALRDLQPGAEYRYQIQMNGAAAAEEFAFRTAGVSSFSFLALGDSGTGSDQQWTIADLINSEPASLVLHTGDLAYPVGGFSQYQSAYLDVYRATMRRTPFFPCLGNHDYYEFRGEPYRAIHDVPAETVSARDVGRYYSFDWGDVHFVSLDSNLALEEAARGAGDMLRWLEADLAASRKFWRVAYFHHPPYATGIHQLDLLTGLARARLAPVLEGANVPLVLNGHEHSYQRTHPLRFGGSSERGTVYVTTGGGGARIYPTEAAPWIAERASRHHYLRLDVAGGSMNVAAIGLDGRPFDRFSLTPPPVAGSVVNAASGTASIGRGGLITVYGWQFSPGTAVPDSTLLAPGAAGVRVMIGGAEAPLLYASPTQLNALLPQDLLGVQTVRVSSPSGDTEAEIEILPVAPAIFPGGLFEDERRQISQASPCHSGARVTAFVTGIGGHDGAVFVLFGGERIGAQLVRSGDLPGVQRVRFQVPSSTPVGSHPVAVEAAGAVSNRVLCPVRTE